MALINECKRKGARPPALPARTRIVIKRFCIGSRAYADSRVLNLILFLRWLSDARHHNIVRVADDGKTRYSAAADAYAIAAD